MAADEADRDFRRQSPSSSPAIVKTVWAFAAIALTSLAVGIASEVTDPNLVEGTLEWAQRSLILIGVGDVAITVVVLISSALISLRVLWPVAKRWKTVWLAATPLLGLTIGLNVGYHFVVRTYLNIPLEADALFAFPELLPWYILLICVQPAVVEELFFRHVALGAALEVMSEKPAIMISSLLFAMAHLGSPLSMPYLAVLGVVLAWLRLKSGGLWLPIVFHFLHNLIVAIVL
ncbi:MAG: type II CAAX endopeptidase family protein [Fuerstiella sp.]